jgi:hypothetical protein
MSTACSPVLAVNRHPLGHRSKLETAAAVSIATVVAAAAIAGCADKVDDQATDAFHRHLENVQLQRARVSYADTEPATAGLESFVLYLSGTPGHFRLDVSLAASIRAPGTNMGERLESSIFVNEERSVTCTSSPLLTEGQAEGVCFEDPNPFFAGLAYELTPALHPDTYADHPVMSTWHGSTIGQETECFEVRVSDPQDLDDIRSDYCFSADSLLMQYGSYFVATAIGAVTDQDFELPYPVSPD